MAGILCLCAATVCGFVCLQERKTAREPQRSTQFLHHMRRRHSAYFDAAHDRVRCPGGTEPCLWEEYKGVPCRVK